MTTAISSNSEDLRQQLGLGSSSTVNFSGVNVTSSTIPANGIYLPAANSLGIATNGTNRITIDSSGNILVQPDESSPGNQKKISFFRTSDSWEMATICGEYGSVYGGALVFKTNRGAAGNNIVESMRIDSSGNVGINITPTNKFDIVDSVADRATLSINRNNSSGNDSSRIILGKTYKWTLMTDVGRAAGNDFSIWNTYGGNDYQLFTIDSSGNVGIGTVPAAWKPEVKVCEIGSAAFAGSIGSLYLDLANNAYFSATGSKYKANGKATLYEQDVNGCHTWFNAAYGTAGDAITFREVMRIDDGGNVGVATTNPSGGHSYSGYSRILGIGGSTIDSMVSCGILSMFCSRATPTAGDYLGSVSFASEKNTQPLKAQIISQIEGSGGVTGGFGGNIQFHTRADNSASLTERMRIDSSGNVAIGYASPRCKFDVSNIAAATSQMGFVLTDGDINGAYLSFKQTPDYSGYQYAKILVARQQTGLAYGSYMAFHTESKSSGTTDTSSEKMRIDADGNVGIGTNSPSSYGKLAVKIDTPATGASSTFLSCTDGTRAFGIGQTGATYSYAGIGSNELVFIPSSNLSALTFGSDGAVPIKFVSNGSERLRIDSSGNVGVGVTPKNGGSSFELGNGSIISYSGNGNVAANGYYNSGWKYYSNAYAVYQEFNAVNGYYALYNAISGTAGNAITWNERLRIDSAGNVGIGVTPSTWSSGNAIEIKSVGNFIQTGGAGAISVGSGCYYNSGWKYSSTGYAGFRYDQTSVGHTWYISSTGTAGNPITFTEAMRIDSNGNVGIGTTPNTWTTAARVIQGYAGSIQFYGFTGNVGTAIGNNYNYDGSNSKYLTSNPAQYLILDSDGSFGFATAPTGTAGNNITFSTKVKIDNSGNIYGVSGGTGMTDGFVYIPSASGAPSGTPTSIAGHACLYWDEANSYLYVMVGSTKKKVLLA